MEDSAEQQPLIEAVADTMEAEDPTIKEAREEAAASPGDDEWSGSYTWRIDFEELEDYEIGKKKYSPKFEVATYFWRLLLFPRGNAVPQAGQRETVSVFLDAPDASVYSTQMSPSASFTLHLHNQLEKGKRHSKDTEHTFTANEADWGFGQFIPREEMMDPSKGWLVNNQLVLSVDLRVKRDERYNLDARKATGFVGLKNQGATCYMNSLLQYLYNLPCFRTAVYHMPTNENDEASKSLPLALQSLFFKLQYSKTHVSTKDLTKSFGWGTYDAFMQHDVQELNRVLCEKLEEKMKGTKVERIINELFEGYTYNYIECINVDYKSTRKESFMDLQLDVKGCKNVYESFAKFCEVEIMEGREQYNAEGHGMQDARKGILFQQLPPVLQLHLKRFEYDFQRDAMIKINDRYEFPELLDLDSKDIHIFGPEAPTNVSNQYKLHSVLVHSGGLHGGHYYVYIRPDGEKWYKFDDDHVEATDKTRACDEQFGAGGVDEDGAMSAPALRYARSSNAYMLVYVRVADWDKVMAATTKEDIAPHLLERLEQEQEEKEARQRMKQEAHLYCTLKLATDADVAAHVGQAGVYFDLVNHNKLPAEHIFRLKKNIRFPEFMQMVQEKLKVPVADQRFWIWETRDNGSFRPARPLSAEEQGKVLMDLREHREMRHGVVTQAQKQSLMDIKLFLEAPLAAPGSFELGPGPLPPRGKFDFLLLFKHYDPVSEVLRYVGRLIVQKNSRLAQLSGELVAMCGLAPGTELECYEEIRADGGDNMVELVPLKATFAEKRLRDGDIIIVQPALPPNTPGVRFADAKSFLGYIHSRRVVTFKRLEEPKEAGLQLELLREMDYDQVLGELARKLSMDDPSRLRLTQHNSWNSQPQRHPVRFRAINSLEALLTHGQHSTDVLYYEVLDMPLDELEKLKTLKVSFHNDKTEFVGELTVRVPKEGIVADVLNELSRQLGPDAAGRRLRLMEVYNSKVFKVCEPSEPVEGVKETYWALRAEAVPADQAGELPPGRTLLHVCHFALDPATAAAAGGDDEERARPAGPVTTFGAPFLMAIDDDQPLSEIAPRIKALLGVPDEEWAKWRFAFLPGRMPEWLGPDDVLGQRIRSHSAPLAEGAPHLGLGHENKQPRRPQGGGGGGYRSMYGSEKAIKINS